MRSTLRPVALGPIALGLAGIFMALATPAVADVKAGVDAWGRGEYKRAVDEWRPAAIAGDADAQFNLGQAYKLGRGVPVDIAMAESWYRKAALQGHPQGETNYGLILFQGGKRAEALPWLEKSVARGEPRAQLVLGTMLYNGDGVPRDWPRAYALMVRSAASGLPQASTVQAQMDQYIPQDQRQKGLVLARQYEADAARSPLPPETSGSGTQTAMRGTEVPPSSYDDNAGPRPVDEAPAQPPVRTKPRPAPVATQAPPPRPAATGKWRVQLGAFGDPNNARKLWGQVAGRFAGRQPYYVKSGALTRLLVGPFASSSEASRACGAVKPCVPVGP
ncbi:SPOR domain-containing protein [Sphingomonas alpina]|uniref:SEL1-like repeat protein n=1 Tax=Sphingomonas alpina TaxID=653931 RepID=A0A7H0LMJ8_9SPHN|nr:SPOR domain-containing protein [Sphingomonas alpina]QNQ10901.1 SEL1-like repeat protein [Sphingomonas alpina]